MKKVLDFISKNNLMKKLNTSISKNNQVYINNTNEENALIVLMEYFLSHDEAVYLVTPNLYKAQIMYDKLSQVLNRDDVCFFPQDEFITNELLVSSIEFRVERINTIKKLIQNPRRIVVINLFGLLKPELPLQKWLDSLVKLKKGNEYSMDVLAEKLIDYGYKKEYIVEKVGDFSVRGGILDVYPLGSKNPYRLDFFGDTLDVIKEFDIETQRSLKKTNLIEILPMVEFFYSNEEYHILENLVNKKIEESNFSEETVNVLRKDLENLDNHNELDRLIRYLPFLTDKHYTLSDFSDKKTLFFIDYHRIVEQNRILVEEVKDWYLSSSDYPKMGFNVLYDFNELLVKKSVMIDYLEYQYSQDTGQTYSVFGKEILVYSQNLDMLYRDLASNIGKKTQLITFKNSNSRAKFIDVLKNKKIEFISLKKNQNIIENTINIMVTEDVFDFNSDSFEFHLITEEAITKKFISRKRGDYISVYKKSHRLNSVNDLKKGDYVVHFDYGIGKFLEIKTMEFGKAVNDYIHIEYRNGDKLYVSLDAIDQIHKYSGSEGFAPRLSKLGGKDWSKAKKRRLRLPLLYTRF